ncbi:NAD-dependent epimerase/dehydratase family protein [Streptacidiphilus sp. EB129]|uniref:NAD-dependent epimerase/dehydratase family protein n=1 Tax=Streptacidiphilus sp. EB129 TaxID=3156262 RepID=UPI0035175686
MHIIGRGFLARNLADAFADAHPEVVGLAAGVSSTWVTDPAEFDREAAAVYEAIRLCRSEKLTLLFFSTASYAMYGTTSGPAHEAGPLFPPSVYGRHKLALESCVRSGGVDHLILRLSHVVGPYQREHQLLPSLVQQVKDGSVTVFRGAHRDLLDVTDLVAVIDRLLREGVRNAVVNVASGMPQPVELIVDGVARRLGADPERLELPGRPSRTEVSLRQLVELVPDFTAASVDGPCYLNRLLDRYLAPAPSLD